VSFDVVVPSLPGFAWSQTMAGHFTRAGVAALWNELLTGVLGYERYGVFGGDIGGGVSMRAAARFPERVVGVHTIHPPFPGKFDPEPTPEEQAFLDAEKAYDVKDQGYSEIMWTRPDTIAAALIDSPAGLAAWIVDKYHDWTDDFAATWDRDTLLTMLTVYWASGSIGTSFRQYFDYEHNEPGSPITVPAAVTLSHEPVMAGFPRSIAERGAADLRHWSEPGRGGHFLPIEQPELVTDELRSFFGPRA
ncbi:MAG TPA: alpha/beta hydrolase, partial [Phytomonospora sp.]